MYRLFREHISDMFTVVLNQFLSRFTKVCLYFRSLASPFLLDMLVLYDHRSSSLLFELGTPVQFPGDLSLSKTT